MRHRQALPSRRVAEFNTNSSAMMRTITRLMSNDGIPPMDLDAKTVNKLMRDIEFNLRIAAHRAELVEDFQHQQTITCPLGNVYVMREKVSNGELQGVPTKQFFDVPRGLTDRVIASATKSIWPLEFDLVIGRCHDLMNEQGDMQAHDHQDATPPLVW